MTQVEVMTLRANARCYSMYLLLQSQRSKVAP